MRLPLAQADPVTDLKGCLVNLNALGDVLEAHFARTGTCPASLEELRISLPPCPARTDSNGYLLESERVGKLSRTGSGGSFEGPVLSQ